MWRSQTPFRSLHKHWSDKRQLTVIRTPKPELKGSEFEEPRCCLLFFRGLPDIVVALAVKPQVRLGESAIQWGHYDVSQHKNTLGTPRDTVGLSQD